MVRFSLRIQKGFDSREPIRIKDIFLIPIPILILVKLAKGIDFRRTVINIYMVC